MKTTLLMATAAGTLIAGCASAPSAPEALAPPRATSSELTCPESANAGAYVVVRDADGQPVPHAAITFRHPGGDLSMHVTADESGRARLQCLTPARDYEIEVTKEGRKPLRVRADLRAGVTIPVTVSMQRIATP